MKIKFPRKKTKDKMKCHQDEQGVIHCESNREFEDGTTQQLASASFQFDGECKAVPISVQENEPGELDKLVKKSVPLLKSKCKSLPKDY